MIKKNTKKAGISSVFESYGEAEKIGICRFLYVSTFYI